MKTVILSIIICLSSGSAYSKVGKLDTSPAYSAKGVGAFVAGAIVGGIIYDGVKEGASESWKAHKKKVKKARKENPHNPIAGASLSPL